MKLLNTCLLHYAIVVGVLLGRLSKEPTQQEPTSQAIPAGHENVIRMGTGS